MTPGYAVESFVPASSWRNLARQLDPESGFAPPVSQDQIAEAEGSLNVEFPSELRELLLETDGLTGRYGISRIWPLARIVRDNIEFRNNPEFLGLYMSFEPLLFFGDDGGGDQYAFRILAGRIEYMDVYEWEHESDSRHWFARGLRDYLARSSGHSQ